MNRSLIRCLSLAALTAAISLAGGCAYLQDRGQDAKDMFDVGVTYNKTARPQFAFYFDFFSLFNFGYTHETPENTRVIGIVNRRAGIMDYESRNWGALIYGSVKDGADPFDPKDPRQARNDQRDLAERPRFETGLARVFVTDEPPPWPQYIMCRRVLHLGWLGFVVNLRPLDMADFLLGWTTLDILGDDAHSRAAATAPAPEKEKQ